MDDLFYEGGFSVDFGLLSDLTELYEALDQAVDSYLQAHGEDFPSGLKTPRLMEMICAIAENVPQGGSITVRDEKASRLAFVSYIWALVCPCGEGSECTEFEDNSGPGLSSEADLFWAKNVTSMVEPIRRNIKQDICELKGC